MRAQIKRFHQKHKKRMFYSLLGFFVLLALTSGPLLVYAGITLTAQRTTEIQDKNAAIEAAIMNNDYYTWHDLETDATLKSKVTPANFSLFAQAFKLLQQGKVEEANVIKKQLSLKQEFSNAAEKSLAIDNAIQHNDYDYWRSLVGNQNPEVTRENFANYANAYKLIQSGRLRTAGFLLRDVGVKQYNPYSSSR